MTYDPAFDDPWLKWLWATLNSHALDPELKRAIQRELDSPLTLAPAHSRVVGALARRCHPRLPKQP
jgi:hypothetical protein